MRNSSKRFMGIPDEFWIGFVIMVGFFLKLVYVSKIGYTGNPAINGVWQESADAVRKGGHLDVISYLYTFHHLPDFNPSGLYGFANPPVYYIFCSLLMEIFHRLMAWSHGISLYVVMAFNAVFVLVGECCGIGIVRKFGVRGRKLMVCILYLMFFPAFYHMSGSFDGSALSFMLSMLSLNSALSWYSSRRAKTLLSAAVELGLALMVNYASVIVLVVILLLIYYASKDGRRNQTPLRTQLKQFAIIVSVMGLIWPIYLTIRFHLPLFYVEKLGEEIAGNLASASYRLSIPSGKELMHLHTVGDVQLEANIWAQTIKTSIFDFTAIRLSGRGTITISRFLLVMTILLGLLMHVMLAYALFAANRISQRQRNLVLVGYVSALAAYVLYCFVIPYTGMMDYKRIAPILIYPLIGMGVCGSWDLSDNLFERVTTEASNVMILIMAFITAFLFGFYY